MGHLARDADLVVKLRQPHRVLLQIARQQFQRDRVTEPEVVGAEHFTHTAFAQQSDDPIAAVEDGSRSEPAVADGVGLGQPAGGRLRGEGCRRAARGGGEGQRRHTRRGLCLSHRQLFEHPAAGGTESRRLACLRVAMRADHARILLGDLFDILFTQSTP